MAMNAEGLALLARAIAGERIPVIQLVYIAQLDPLTGLEVGPFVPQRWAACGTQLAWDGSDWVAVDIAISEIEDTVNGLNGQTFALPGVTESEIAFAFDDVDGATVRVYDAWVDPDTGEVADAVLAWSGEMDIPGWQDGPEASVLFTAVHHGNAALRPKPSLYTDDEQRRLYLGDTSMAFDPATDAGPVVWPNAAYFKQP